MKQKKKNIGYMVEPILINTEKTKMLAADLKLNQDDRRVIETKELLEEMAEFQQVLDVSRNSQPLSEVHKEADDIIKHLALIERIVEGMDANQEKMFDYYFLFANKNAPFQLLQLAKNHPFGGSGFEVMVSMMLKDAKAYKASLSQKRTSTKNCRYTVTLKILAERFKIIFKDDSSRVSANPNSRFYHVVCFFFTSVIHSEINDPAAQIKKMLDKGV